MYRIKIGKGIFTYLVGNQTVAIISPNRKKFEVSFGAIHEASEGLPVNYTQNGTADARIAPEEIAAYVMKHKLG
jgi:hypothetical protein